VDDAVVGFYTLPRFDMVNLSLGIKFTLFDHAVAYVDAVIPVTNQGLRASVIPAGGVAYDF